MATAKKSKKVTSKKTTSKKVATKKVVAKAPVQEVVKTFTKHARQGDVNITLAGSEVVEEKEVPRVNKVLVLQKGMVTGHAHRILDKGAKLFEIKPLHATNEALTQRLLVVDDKPVSLVHDEHDTIAIPPGRWLVTIQREYNAEFLRQVQD